MISSTRWPACHHRMLARRRTRETTKPFKQLLFSGETQVVKRTKILAVVLASATGLTATALTSVERHLSAPDRRPVLQAAANSQKNTGQKGKRPAPHMGE